MSTRGRIGLLLDSGEIVSIYSHWDNYPQHNGRILIEKFNTEEKVRELIDGGDISSLETNIDWDGNRREGPFTLSYRDRGDIDVDPELSEDEREFFALTRGCDGEYAYVFDPVTKVWSCYDMHGAVTVPLYAELVS